MKQSCTRRGLKEPLTTIVHDDFSGVMKRIKEVTFLPHRILIVLLPTKDWAAKHAIKISVLLLHARISFLKEGVATTNVVSLTDLNVDGLIYYDEDKHVLSIPIKNTFALHLMYKKGQNFKIFTKK